VKVIGNWRQGLRYLKTLELLAEMKREDVAKELGIHITTLNKRIELIRIFSMRADFFVKQRNNLIKRSAYIGGLLAPQKPEEIEEIEEEL